MRALVLSMLVGCAAANSAPAKSQDAPAPARALNVGDPAPEVAKGKVTLVVFWATWSEPSKKMLITLEETWRRTKARGLVIRAVSIDDEPTYVPEFSKTYGLTFPLEWDKDHRVASLYRLSSSEAVYVVDRKGIVRFIHLGYHDAEDQEIAAHVDSLL
jgi:cytochrome c biogenesis protein CcmG, thiol:disulfide interchange protein DsbE